MPLFAADGVFLKYLPKRSRGAPFVLCLRRGEISLQLPSPPFHLGYSADARNTRLFVLGQSTPRRQRLAVCMLILEEHERRGRLSPKKVLGFGLRSLCYLPVLDYSLAEATHCLPLAL